LKDLLDPAGELVGWLRPVVILHRDYEDSLDIVGASAKAAHCTQKGKRPQGAAMSDL
jgi:hypothetical protein